MKYFILICVTLLLVSCGNQKANIPKGHNNTYPDPNPKQVTK
ncbi:hypothetical protein HAV_00844 [Candidatus Hepatincola sp. Av]